MSSSISSETAEVHNLLEKAARGIPAPARRKRAEVYGTGLVVLGLAVPDQRRLAAAPFAFLDGNGRDVLRAWDRVYRESPVFEARSLALLYFENRFRQYPLARIWPVLRRWARSVDNWEHADRLAKIYAEFLEKDPDRVYPTLQRWNQAPGPWLRRLSVVSLLCYASLRTQPPPREKVFPLLERLVHDRNVYVQKGLGWTLRESALVYPAETRRFLEQHVDSLAPIAFTIALEKADGPLRERLKLKRKENRRTGS